MKVRHCLHMLRKQTSGRVCRARVLFFMYQLVTRTMNWKVTGVSELPNEILQPCFCCREQQASEELSATSH